MRGDVRPRLFSAGAPVLQPQGGGEVLLGKVKLGEQRNCVCVGGGRLHVERALPRNWHQETRAQQAGDSPKLSLSSLVNEHFSKDGLRPPLPKQLANSASPCCF